MTYHIIQGSRLVAIREPTANAVAAARRRLGAAPRRVSGATLLGRLSAPQLAAVQTDAAKQAAAGSPTLANWLAAASQPNAMVAVDSPLTRIVARVLVANGVLSEKIAKSVFAP